MADLEGTFYLVVQKKSYPQGNRDALIAKRASSNPPSVLEAGQVALQFRVVVPAEAFKPLLVEDPIRVKLENVVRSAEAEVEE
jgi:hypothetical protein